VPASACMLGTGYEVVMKLKSDVMHPFSVGIHGYETEDAGEPDEHCHGSMKDTFEEVRVRL
jgi:hypothetical protein